jgi:hypothetical protein
MSNCRWRKWLVVGSRSLLSRFWPPLTSRGAGVRDSTRGGLNCLKSALVLYFLLLVLLPNASFFLIIPIRFFVCTYLFTCLYIYIHTYIPTYTRYGERVVEAVLCRDSYSPFPRFFCASTTTSMYDVRCVRFRLRLDKKKLFLPPHQQQQDRSWPHSK